MVCPQPSKHGISVQFIQILNYSVCVISVLQPVNGYKIADKIILANKELFESEQNGQSADIVASDTAAIGLNQLGSPSTSVENSSDSQRRVTFRPDLEDFEPEFITDVEDDDVDEDASLSDDAEVTDIQPVETTDEFTTPILPQTPTTAEMSVSDLTRAEIEEICEEIEDLSLADSASCNPIAVESQNTSDKTDTDDDKEQPPVQPNSTISTIDKPATEIYEEPVRRQRTPSFQRSDSERSGSSQRPHRHHHEHNRRASASGTTTAGDFLKIQLNFKPCCEYKTVENNRLPRYSGYFSQYGLSKEQLELRDLLRERSHRRKYQRIERKSEEELIKSQVNEEAFARWLQVKMKSAQGSTRNMYDYHAKQAKKSKKKA